MQSIFDCTYCSWAAHLGLALLAAGIGCHAEAGEVADAPPVADGNAFVLGVGAASAPRYSGSDQNAVAPVLLLDYSTASGFFASTLRGLGYGGQVGGFGYSAALGFRGARKETDQIASFGNTGSDRLQGMGEIKGNASAVLAVVYTAMPGLDLGLSTDVPLTQKDNGINLHASMTLQLYGKGADRLSLGLATGFADSKYAQTYYGVSKVQAARSHFGAYLAGAGLYEATGMLTWEHKLDQRWGITSMLGANRLLQDAGRSPLAERKTAPTAAVYASYAY
jgi:outer membrane scaffolding protein for murein synthesis (MipA/OmpV family)